MDIRIVDNYKGFESLRSAWNRLLEISDYDSVFLTFEWFAEFIRSFELGSRLRIVTIWEEGELVGILPLYCDLYQYGKIKFKFLRSVANVHTPKFNAIVKSGCDGIFKDVFGLIGASVDWDAVQLDYLSETSPFFNEFAGQKCKDFDLKRVKIMASPYLPIGGDWENYYKGLSKNVRTALETRAKKAEKTYRIEYERVEGPLLSPDVLHDAFKMEDSGWKGKNRSSILKNEQVTDFYRSLALSMNEKGYFEMLFLKFSGDRVAFDYCLKYKGIYSMVKIGYDEKYKDYSPGMILRKHVLREFFEKGYEKYDFLGGSDEYKLKFTKAIDQLYSVYLFNKSLKGKLLEFIQFGAGELADKLRVKRFLRHLVKKKE